MFETNNMTAKQYRSFDEGLVWLYNPWTGEKRSEEDRTNDPQGHKIVPPAGTLRIFTDRYAAPSAAADKQQLIAHTAASAVGKAILDLLNTGKCRLEPEYMTPDVALAMNRIGQMLNFPGVSPVAFATPKTGHEMLQALIATAPGHDPNVPAPARPPRSNDTIA